MIIGLSKSIIYNLKLKFKIVENTEKTEWEIKTNFYPIIYQLKLQKQKINNNNFQSCIRAKILLKKLNRVLQKIF